MHRDVPEEGPSRDRHVWEARCPKISFALGDAGSNPVPAAIFATTRRTVTAIPAWIAQTGAHRSLTIGEQRPGGWRPRSAIISRRPMAGPETLALAIQVRVLAGK